MRLKELRGPGRSRSAVLTASLCLLAAVSGTPSAQAAPKLRYQIDQHGDVLLFGNTVGYDCRTGIPAPVVGTVDPSMCGDFTSDSSADVWWMADMPSTGQAVANTTISKVQARSTAMFALPAGAQVTYARLYISATYDEAEMPNGIVQFDRPGTFMQMLTAQPSDIDRNIVGGSTYQASFDVTSVLQKYGAGAYRVTGVPGLSATNVNSDVNYAAWSIVVAYQRDADPVRNLTIFDGLTGVGGGQQADISLSGFRVPTAGAPDAKLGIVAFEGDHDKMQDSLIFNGTKLNDGTPGSEDNFFNSSRLDRGQAISLKGDLPQLTGAPASMVGLDLDIVDVSTLVKNGDTMAQVSVRSLADDVVFVGALVTSITSNKPIIQTVLTSTPGGPARPGDPIVFTSTTKNIGNDTGNNVTIRHILPPELDYVPGSCEIVSGPNSGKKSDALGDDQCEVVDVTDPQTGKPTRQIVVRIGTGGNATMGGSINPNDPPIVVRYRAKVKDDAPPGDVPTRSTTTTIPPGGNTPIDFPSCAPVMPCQPTVINLPPCGSALDCGTSKPYCDTTGTGGAMVKGQCTDKCKVSADCIGYAGGEVCDTSSSKCVPCTANSHDACAADGPGSVCMTGGTPRCGCASNADCGGRTCSNNACPPADSDLVVEVVQTPDPVGPDMPVTYEVDVTNKGPARDPGPVHVTFEIPPDSGGYIDTVTPGPGWRCTLTDRTVKCTHPSPLDPNMRQPAVTVVVKPYDPANTADPNNPSNPNHIDPPSVQVHATVGSDGSVDPNPADNSAYRLTSFGDGLYRLAGGGTSCAMGQNPSQSSAWAIFAAAMMMGAGLLRSRRRREHNA